MYGPDCICNLGWGGTHIFWRLGRGAEGKAMNAGRQPIQVTWLAITDAGRQALAG
jgi:hypothetical protein